MDGAPSAFVRRVVVGRPAAISLKLPAQGAALGVLSFVGYDGRVRRLPLRLLRRQANHPDRYVLAAAAGASVVLRTHSASLLSVQLPERSRELHQHARDPRVVLRGTGARMLRLTRCAALPIHARVQPNQAGRSFDSRAAISEASLRANGFCTLDRRRG